MAAVLLCGAIAYKQLGISALPEVDYPTIQVVTFYPGASPDVTASGIAYWGNDIGGWQYLPAVHHPAHPPLLDPSDARDNVGGYDDYPELYTRWFEYGAFQPNFRTHGSRRYNEVWSYGKEAEPILEWSLEAALDECAQLPARNAATAARTVFEARYRGRALR